MKLQYLRAALHSKFQLFLGFGITLPFGRIWRLRMVGWFGLSLTVARQLSCVSPDYFLLHIRQENWSFVLFIDIYSRSLHPIHPMRTLLAKNVFLADATDRDLPKTLHVPLVRTFWSLPFLRVYDDFV